VTARRIEPAGHELGKRGRVRQGGAEIREARLSYRSVPSGDPVSELGVGAHEGFNGDGADLSEDRIGH
jgi:hypothetical protein